MNSSSCWRERMWTNAEARLPSSRIAGRTSRAKRMMIRSRRRMISASGQPSGRSGRDRHRCRRLRRAQRHSDTRRLRSMKIMRSACSRTRRDTPSMIHSGRSTTAAICASRWGFGVGVQPGCHTIRSSPTTSIPTASPSTRATVDLPTPALPVTLMRRSSRDAGTSRARGGTHRYSGTRKLQLPEMAAT